MLHIILNASDNEHYSIGHGRYLRTIAISVINLDWKIHTQKHRRTPDTDFEIAELEKQ